MGIVNPLLHTHVESEADRTRRIAHEAQMIAEAEASMLAGDTITHDQFRAWSESLLANPEQPHPPPS